MHCQVIEEIAGRNIVGTIDEEMILLDYVAPVREREKGVVFGHGDGGVERVQKYRRGMDFGDPDSVLGMDNLTLEIGLLHSIVIHDTQMTHS